MYLWQVVAYEALITHFLTHLKVLWLIDGLISDERSSEGGGEVFPNGDSERKMPS